MNSPITTPNTNQAGESSEHKCVPMEIENPIQSSVNDRRVALSASTSAESTLTSNEYPINYKLSAIVSRLAVANFVIDTLALLISYLVEIIRIYSWGESNPYILSEYIQRSVPIIVCFTAVGLIKLFCGIHGVKTRNEKYCACCCNCCGFLTGFYILTILAAVGSAFSVIINPIVARAINIDTFIYGVRLHGKFLVESIIFLVWDIFRLFLRSFTAEYSRRLIVAFGRDAVVRERGNILSDKDVSSHTDRSVLSNGEAQLEEGHGTLDI